MDNNSTTDSSTQHSVTNNAVGGPITYTCLDGVKRLYILLLAGAAVAFSIVVIFSCEFFSYRSLDGQPWEGLNVTLRYTRPGQCWIVLLFDSNC